MVADRVSALILSVVSGEASLYSIRCDAHSSNYYFFTAAVTH
jgi:hypothetical protein